MNLRTSACTAACLMALASACGSHAKKPAEPDALGDEAKHQSAADVGIDAEEPKPVKPASHDIEVPPAP